MLYIHQNENWPDFIWNSETLSPALAAVRYAQGQLVGRMQASSFRLRQEASLRALTDDVVKSSAIEGEQLNPQEVRSSIVRRLGLEAVLHKAYLYSITSQLMINERQKIVIDRMLEDDWEGHLNTSKYAKLAKTSRDTALRDIRELLTGGILVWNPGGGRSTSYRLAKT